MITLALPGLREYCQITYNIYRDACKSVGMEFDENGEFMHAVEKRAREEVFPEHLDQIRAKGYEVELFDLEPLVYPPVDKRMKYARRNCWGSDRLLCQLEKDGEVRFANDITLDELKYVVTALLRESETRRQKILDGWSHAEKKD